MAKANSTMLKAVVATGVRNVLVAEEGIGGVGDDPRQQGGEEEVHEPVGVGGDEGPATAEGGSSPRHTYALLSSYSVTQIPAMIRQERNDNEVKNGSQRTSGPRPDRSRCCC